MRMVASKMEARDVTGSSRHCPTATSRAGVNCGRTPGAMIGVTLHCDRNITVRKSAVVARDFAANGLLS
jgi:hypothetical protein